MQATFVRPNKSDAFANANAYRHLGIETGVSGASPHRLVAMLFDGVQDSIAQARGAIRCGDLATKGQSIARALRIVSEGLDSALNTDAGGRLALELRDLYDYIALRLTQANLNNDDAALAECARLIEPVRSAWRTIAVQVQTPRPVADRL
ncbi:MAG: flagellar export chaperone FliS [Burkholderiaceae bacterium]